MAEVDLGFPDYATRYSKKAREDLSALPTALRATMIDIDNELAEAPDKHPNTTLLAGNFYSYEHPQPRIIINYVIDSEPKIITFLQIVAPTLEVRKPIFISYSHQDEQ